MTHKNLAADELRMLTINDIKRRLNVCRNTAYDRTREEGFPLPYIFGGSYRWPEDEFEEWMRKQRATSRAIAPAARARKPSQKAPKKAIVKNAPLSAPKPVGKRTLVGASA